MTVSRPNSSLNQAQKYNSEKEVREFLLDIGIPNDVLDFYCLKLLPRVAEDEELAFPEMDIPKLNIRRAGFDPARRLGRPGTDSQASSQKKIASANLRFMQRS